MEKRSGDECASYNPSGTWRKVSAEVKGRPRGTSLLIQYPHAVLDPDWTRRENTERFTTHHKSISPSVHPSGSETCCQLRCVAERAGTLATSSNPICPVLLTFTPCEQNTIDMPTINTIIMPKSGHSPLPTASCSHPGQLQAGALGGKIPCTFAEEELSVTFRALGGEINQLSTRKVPSQPL